ncbi:thioredoxin family protein [Frankia sp. R82]|uniref:thioredoxin family protein n=1 Tax=Frankia sp. R82 TaxID=2950553 RepID=UPI002042D2B5|nr:thioredoxin family protein [Frankia sp. R82]MCM3885458.1 thioredoxin family protein [Frankia sp. R82]
MTGLWVLLSAVALATALGVTTRVRDGRFRVARSARSRRSSGFGVPSDGRLGVGSGEQKETAVDMSVPSAPAAGAAPGQEGLAPARGAEIAALGETLGERATLLQFSTAFCAPCRVTRRVLAGVAEVVPGVRHLEVDAEAHLELVRALGVRRTPTVLVLDAGGREVRRASGAPPTRAAVFATLAEIMPMDGAKRSDDDSSESSPMS